MAYVFEKISDEIREKIFADVKRDVLEKKISLKSRHLYWYITQQYEGLYDSAPTEWVVDYEKNYYIFWVSIGAPGLANAKYVFYYQEVCYEVLLKNFSTGEMELYNPYGPPIGDLEPAFFEEFKTAFVFLRKSTPEGLYHSVSIEPKFKGRS